MSASTSWTNLLQWKLQQKQKKIVKNLEFSASVNEHGLAEFKDIPIGVYKVLVPEFRDYHSAEGEARMIDPNQDGFFTSFVEIFKTGLAVTQVYVEFPKQMV